jgi:protein SCO1/2
MKPEPRALRWKMLAGIVAVVAMLAHAEIPITAQNSRWGANYFPNVTLTTQDGASVHFYDDLIKGKIVAINLIYTTCKYACPLETARLAQVQTVLGDRMGRDVFFYSITIDPEHDTPTVLKAYAEKFHAGPGWLFLTGSRADIDLISKKIGLYAPPNPSDPDGHVPSLLVGNEVTGQWMRNSGLDNPKFLARTIGDWLASWRGPKRELKSYAEATPLTLDRGEYTFKNHCAACHTIGRGEHIGPDLLGITKTRDRAWLARFILAPDKMLADGDPIARELLGKYKNLRMPNLALSHEDVRVLVDYLAKQDAAAAVPATASAPAAAVATAITAIVEAYLRIQTALSADTLAGVKPAARSLASEAAKLGSIAESIRSAANDVQQSGDLKSARTTFGRLGDAIMNYARASNIRIADDVHVAYCPMLRKFWLQKGVKIQNPYYGMSMLECGRLTRESSDLSK